MYVLYVHLVKFIFFLFLFLGEIKMNLNTFLYTNDGNNCLQAS